MLLGQLVLDSSLTLFEPIDCLVDFPFGDVFQAKLQRQAGGGCFLA